MMVIRFPGELLSCLFLHEVERVSVLKLKGSVAAVATFCSVVLLYDRYPTHRGHC